MVLLYIYYLIFTDFFTPVHAYKHETSCVEQFLTGDVVLRESRGLLASVFKSCSLHEKKYSHAGIIVIKQGMPVVCHYIDEAPAFREESFESFVSERGCSSYAVYRYSLTSHQLSALQSVIDEAECHPAAFDSEFDLQTDEKMYCTEWIYKTFKKINVQMPVSCQRYASYVAPDNLYIGVHSLKITGNEY